MKAIACKARKYHGSFAGIGGGGVKGEGKKKKKSNYVYYNICQEYKAKRGGTYQLEGPGLAFLRLAERV